MQETAAENTEEVDRLDTSGINTASVEDPLNIPIWESDKQYQFLLSRGIDPEQIIQLDLSTANSLMMQTQANEFTDEQVQQYVNGRISIKNSPERFYNDRQFELSEDGSQIIEEDGNILPNLINVYKVPPTGEEDNAPFSTSTLTYDGKGGMNSDNKTIDQTGVFYKIQSDVGFTEVTAYATMPKVENCSTIGVPYMFLAVNSNSIQVFREEIL